MNSFFKQNKTQSSLEFLMIFAIGFVIITILGGIFFNYSNESKNTLDNNQIDKIGNELMSNIEKIYFLGNNNMISLNTQFPEGITNFTIEHRNISSNQFEYLNITYLGNKGLSSNIFQTSENYIRFNCTNCYHTTNVNGNYTSYYNESDFSGGSKKIKILSKGNYVEISFIKG